jgi:para-nitrobenzyl esterase
MKSATRSLLFRPATIAFVIALFGISVASAGYMAPIAGDPVTIDSGRVAGTVLESGVHAYLGVPFAAPPVGELRWPTP